MKLSKFENFLKKSSETDRDFPFHEASWEELERRLDKPEKRRFIWLWFLLPILLIGFGYSVLRSAADQITAQQEPMIYEQKNAKQIVAEKETKGNINNSHKTSNEKQSIIAKATNGKQAAVNEIIHDAISSTEYKQENALNNKENKKAPIQKTKQTDISIRKNKELIAKNNLHDDSDQPSTALSRNVKLDDTNTEMTTRDEKAKEEKKEHLIESVDNAVETPGVSSITSLSLIAEQKPSKKTNDNMGGGIEATKIAAGGMMNNHGISTGFKLKEQWLPSSWEIGLSFGTLRVDSWARLSLMTTDTNNISFPTPIYPTSITVNEDGVERVLYLAGPGSKTIVYKSHLPIFRLSVGKQITRAILLRGGFSFLYERERSRPIRNLLNDTSFDYAVRNVTTRNYWFADVGVHFQPNRKRLKPFAGVSALIGMGSKIKSRRIIYSADKSIKAKQDVISIPDNTIRLVGLNFEAGLKYQLTRRFEIGIEAFELYIPCKTCGAQVLTDIQFGLQVNYKL